MLTTLKLMFLVYIFFVGIISFLLVRKHFLSMLISLEFTVLSLFFVLFWVLSLFNFEVYLILYFLVFSVCEGALGISILVALIRTHGNDYFSSFSVLQC